MQRYFVRHLSLLVLLIVVFPGKGMAKVAPERHGIVWTAADSVAAERAARAGLDSLLKAGPLKGHGSVEYAVQKLRPRRDLTADFYLLTALCLILGAIRYGDGRYFNLLAGAYRGAGNSGQLRDLLQAAALPNLGMNVFFCAVAGAYIYYLTGGARSGMMSSRPVLLLPALIAGMMLLYAGKYAVIRFSGWVFRVEELAGEYLFNVFLVNKIIGIVLLPFVIIIALAGEEWLKPMGIVSGAVVLALLATRYLRSWSAFYAVFRGSRFHFFTYLCASEILPMAVLVKWLLHFMRA